MITALSVLRSRDFAALWTAGTIVFIGQWVLYVGLPIHVFLLTGSALATSGIFAASAIPRLLFGSLAGVYVDRWDRRQTLLLTSVLQAAAVLPLLLVRSAESVWIVYVVAAIGSTLAQIVGPAENALLPRLVVPEQLAAANALNALNNNISRLIGPALGGVIAATAGLSGITLFTSGSFLVAAALVATIRSDAGRQLSVAVTAGATRIARLWSEWLAGLRLVAYDGTLRVIFLLMALSAIGEGVFGVLYVLFVSKVLGGGPTEIGLFMSCQAVGGVVGAIAVVSVAQVVRPAMLLGVAVTVFGFIDLAIFNAPTFSAGLPAIALLFVLVGVPAAAIFPTVNTLIQARVVDAYRGRVFGALATTIGLFGLIGIATAGLLGDVVGVVPILNVQAVAHIVGGVVFLLLLRGKE